MKRACVWRVLFRLLPIVSSEWGYSTAEGAVSEARQADYLSRQWLANLAAGVHVSIFYDWRDDGNNARDREHRFETVRRNLEPKPSFLAARWRPLRIELRPHTATSHWGGAGDGTAHLPLTWEALLLIDSARRGRSGPQSILVASPFYVLDR